MRKNFTAVWLAFGALALASWACLIGGNDVTPEAAPTITLAPLPEPTIAPTNTPDTAATQAAQAAAQATSEAQAALDAQINKIADALEDFAVSPDQGALAYTQTDPVKINLNTYRAFGYRMVDPDEASYSDFVLYTEATWESSSGLMTCGIAFRAEDNLEEGEQYLFQTLRLSGLPGWDIELWEFGRWQATLTGDVKYNSVINQSIFIGGAVALVNDAVIFDVPG